MAAWSSRASIVVAAFWAIAVLPATTLPMTDPDTFWHVRAGREILDRGRVATVDEWSIAGAGSRWVSQDWLSNVVMASGYRAGDLGPTVLSLGYGLVGAAAIAILWSAVGLRRHRLGWLSRTAWLLFGLVLAAPVLGVRVQVVDLLLASVVLWVLWRYLSVRRPVELIALPAIAALWVNLHAGFPLLFLLGGAVLVGEGLDRLLRRTPDGDPLGWIEWRWLLAALVSSAGALMLNPNGPLIYAYPFQTLGISALAEFVGEWQPATLDAPAGQLLALFVVGGVLPTLALAWRQMRAADALVLLGLVLMATIAVRFLLVSGPIGAAIVCVVLMPRVAASHRAAALSRLAARWSRPEAGQRADLNGAFALALVAIGLTLAVGRVTPEAQRISVAERYPVEAVRWLNAVDGRIRIFNRYEWGGYLGLHVPSRPIFIDGRADVYGDDVIREYVETISVTTDPQETFDRYAIDHVLYPLNSTLGRWLEEQEGWIRAYEEDVGAVWMKADS